MPDAPLEVLVCVDDSRHWEVALSTIGVLARATRARVTLLATVWSETKRDAAFDAARRILDLPASDIRTTSEVGLVENVLPAEARRGDYDLVVVGRLGGLDWLTNHLLANLIVRRSPTSVLIVRGRSERFERIVVATEGPRHGETDVRAAIRLAKVLGARVTVLHVVSQVALSQAGHDELARARNAFLEGGTPEAEHLRAMRELLARSAVKGGVKVRVGSVVEEILEEIREGRHDLLVLGAHETGGDEASLYQDITALLVRASPVSCFVVRGDGLGRGP